MRLGAASSITVWITFEPMAHNRKKASEEASKWALSIRDLVEGSIVEISDPIQKPKKPKPQEPPLPSRSSHEFKVFHDLLNQYRDLGERAETMFRGSYVHLPWLNPEKGFQRFIRDVGRCPDDCEVLFRVDKRVGYVPHNVEWRPPKLGYYGNKNRANLVYVTIAGIKRHASEWSRVRGFKNNQVVSSRLCNGWHPYAAVLGRQGESKADAHKRLMLEPVAGHKIRGRRNYAKRRQPRKGEVERRTLR